MVIKDPNTGKIKFHSGDYGWSGKPITDQDYQFHLEGKKIYRYSTL
jgi:hypothetical protein